MNMALIIFPKLTKEEADVCIKDIQEWFTKNPRRKVCKTDLFTVRRNSIVQDILRHTK